MTPMTMTKPPAESTKRDQANGHAYDDQCDGELCDPRGVVFGLHDDLLLDGNEMITTYDPNDPATYQ